MTIHTRSLMKVSKNLRKQIIIEIIALIFFIAVIFYAVYAIKKSHKTDVSDYEGYVVVLNDEKVGEVKPLSDGAGLEQEGLTYTVTNNNKVKSSYKIVVKPNTTDEDILKQIRISTDDLYIEDLTSLEKTNDGYIITTNELDAGYTKIHLIKYWYKLNTDSKNIKKDLKFDFRLIKEEA